MSDSECSLHDSRLLPCGHLLAAPGARGQDHVTHQLDGALSTETITLQGAQPLRKSPGPPAPKQNQVWLSESSLQLQVGSCLMSMSLCTGVCGAVGTGSISGILG